MDYLFRSSLMIKSIYWHWPRWLSVGLLSFRHDLWTIDFDGGHYGDWGLRMHWPSNRDGRYNLYLISNFDISIRRKSCSWGKSKRSFRNFIIIKYFCKNCETSAGFSFSRRVFCTKRICWHHSSWWFKRKEQIMLSGTSCFSHIISSWLRLDAWLSNIAAEYHTPAPRLH